MVAGICQINSTCVGEIALAANTSPGNGCGGGAPGSGVGVATGVGIGVGLGGGSGLGVGTGVGVGPPPPDVLTETAFDGADILIPPGSRVLMIYT